MPSSDPGEGEARAATALRAGGVVAIPTDTVYGLAALACEPAACRRIFELKGRPEHVALPVLVADLDQGLALTRTDAREALRRVAASLWPGALTVVVPAASRLELGGDPGSVGLRCPADELVRRLAGAVGALATTSANRHGEPPARTAQEVHAAFGDALDHIVDGGRRAGVPSTVVSLLGTDPVLLRAGTVELDAVRQALA